MEIIIKDKLLYKQIIENSREVIFVTDLEFKLVFFNHEFFKVLRYDESFMHKSILEFLIPQSYVNSFQELYHEINLFGKSELLTHILEVYYNDINDKKIPFEVKIIVYQNDENEIRVIFICRDVSEALELQNKQNRSIEELHLTRTMIEQNANELVRLNEVISESEHKLKELNASKDKFFSIISHDLKNPFQLLIGYSELLATQINIFTQEEIQEVSVSLHDTTKNVYKLLENLLEWARIQKGSMPLNPEEFDIYLMVKSNFEMVLPKANLKNVTLTNNIPKDIPIFADENMINTVIRNLISNSLKFTNDNGNITLNYRDEDNFHKIDIKDTGVGMPEKVLNKLFKIDEHVTTLGTNQETGTGLGLILCKELVNKNKGNIIVESEVGVGTTFTITIPKNLEEMLNDETKK